MAIKAGALCAFAGHPTKVAEKPAEAESADGQDGEGPANGARQPVVDPTAKAAAAAVVAAAAPVSAEVAAAALHRTAGLLSGPVDAPGLVLTLGPQPSLDATHKVLGIALTGRRVLRRLDVLAPLTVPSAAPAQPVFMRLIGPQETTTTGSSVTLDGKVEAPKSSYTVEPAPLYSSEPTPLSEEPAAETEAAQKVEEQLDVADIEINGREVEVSDLKGMTFSRERQNGVEVVNEALTQLGSRLQALENLDETQSGQRYWLQERINLQLRVLKKLR